MGDGGPRHSLATSSHTAKGAAACAARPCDSMSSAKSSRWWKRRGALWVLWYRGWGGGEEGGVVRGNEEV